MREILTKTFTEAAAAAAAAAAAVAAFHERRMSRKRPPRPYFNFSKPNVFYLPCQPNVCLKAYILHSAATKWNSTRLYLLISQALRAGEIYKNQHIPLNTPTSKILLLYFAHNVHIYYRIVWKISCLFLNRTVQFFTNTLAVLQQCIFWSFACSAYAWYKMFKKMQQL